MDHRPVSSGVDTVGDGSSSAGSGDATDGNTEQDVRVLLLCPSSWALPGDLPVVRLDWKQACEGSDGLLEDFRRVVCFPPDVDWVRPPGWRLFEKMRRCLAAGASLVFLIPHSEDAATDRRRYTAGWSVVSLSTDFSHRCWVGGIAVRDLLRNLIGVDVEFADPTGRSRAIWSPYRPEQIERFADRQEPHIRLVLPGDATVAEKAGDVASLLTSGKFDPSPIVAHGVVGTGSWIVLPWRDQTPTVDELNRVLALFEPLDALSAMLREAREVSAAPLMDAPRAASPVDSTSDMRRGASAPTESVGQAAERGEGNRIVKIEVDAASLTTATGSPTDKSRIRLWVTTPESRRVQHWMSRAQFSELERLEKQDTVDLGAAEGKRQLAGRLRKRLASIGLHVDRPDAGGPGKVRLLDVISIARVDLPQDEKRALRRFKDETRGQYQRGEIE